MSISDYISRFNILYNNIESNQSMGVTHQQIYYFLNKSQLELVKNYFTQKGNKYAENYNGSPIRQSSFYPLINSITLPENTGSTSPKGKKILLNGFKYSEFLNQNSSNETFDRNNVIAIIEENVDVFKYDSLSNSDIYQQTFQVVPLSMEQLSIILHRAYKQPLKNQVWRLNIYKSNNNTSIIFGGKYDYNLIYNYNITYVAKPIEFSDNSVTNMPESFSDEIIQRAVELAKVFYAGDSKEIIEIGNRTE